MSRAHFCADARWPPAGARCGHRQALRDFGEHGAVNLLKDMRSQFKEGDEWRNYLVTSPPAILDGKVIVGSSIGDNRAVLEELGSVRAFDARSGKLGVELGSDPAGSIEPGL